MIRWAEYKGEFYMVGKNVNGALLFESEFVIGSSRPQRIQAFDAEREREFADRLRRIMVRDMMDELGRIKDKHGMQLVLGMELTYAEFFRVRTELYRVKSLATEGGMLVKTLKNLFRAITKGSRILRLAVTMKESRVYKDNDITMHRSILGITNMEEELDREICELHMGIWAKTFLRPGFKDFLYRYTHGRLHVNNVRANFEDIDRWCTFCMKKEKIELRNEGIMQDSQEYRDRMDRLPVETVTHLFWDCLHTKPQIETICRELGWENMYSNEFMIGRREGNVLKDELGIIIKHWIKYWIYSRKVEGRVIRLIELRNGLDKFMQYVVNNVKKYRGIAFNE